MFTSGKRSLLKGILGAFVASSLLSMTAQARVFSFQSENIGAYFRGSYGMSALGDKPFKTAIDTPTPTYNSQKHTNSFSGELGFMVSVQESATLRLGVEVLQDKASEITGSSGATKHFDLVSDLLVVSPIATLEFHFKKTPTSRFSVFGGAALSSVTHDLAYTFTTAGSAAYGSVADYTEKTEDALLSAHYGFMFEFLMVDTTTMVLELGHRYMPVNSLNYKSAVTRANGAVAKGDAVKNADGTDRKLDLGGFFLGLSFRFWL